MTTDDAGFYRDHSWSSCTHPAIRSGHEEDRTAALSVLPVLAACRDELTAPVDACPAGGQANEVR